MLHYTPSRFNFAYSRNPNENVIYNTFSKALVVLDDEEYRQYSTGAFSNHSTEQQLIDNGVLVDSHFDETGFLKYFHYKKKFDNDILYLTIAPTLDCNFACPYCYETRRSGKMSLEVQNALINYIQTTISQGVRVLDISWYGGEPLMCVDIVESLARRIQSITTKENCLLRMHMVTNGYLLTPLIIDRLDKTGITKLQITLDGLDERHNIRRPLRNGKGTFNEIMQNLSMFADSPIEVCVRMNVDNNNCKDFQPLKEKIAELNNPNIKVYASPVEDLNKDIANDISDFMTTEEFEAFTLKTCDDGVLSVDDFSVMDDRYCFCTAETENCYVIDDLGDCYKCWDEVGRSEYRCFNLLDPGCMNYSMVARYLTSDPFSDQNCNNCVFLPLCFGGCKFQKTKQNKSTCGFSSKVLIKYLETAFFHSSGKEVE